MLIQAVALTILSFCVVYFDLHELNTMILASFMAMAFIFMGFTAAPNKIYFAEVTNNATLGLVYLYRSIITLIVGILVPNILVWVGMRYFFVAITCFNLM